MADVLAAQQIADGASHQYRLDETSGTTATDRGSVPINGTYTNPALNQPTLLVPGSTGSLYLNGSTAYVDFAWDVTATLSAAWSLEIVYQANSVGATATRLFANDAPNSTSKGTQLVADNYASTYGGASAAFVGGNAYGTPAAGFGLIANVRHIVHVVWRGTAGNVLEYWIDGTKVQSLTTSGNYVAAGYHMRVGMDPQSGTNWWQGWVSDFALYNFALTTAQIANHVSKLVTSAEGSPALWTPAFGAAFDTPKVPVLTNAFATRPTPEPSFGVLGENVSVVNVSGVGQIFPTGRS